MLTRYLLCIQAPDEVAGRVERIGLQALPAKSNVRGSSAPVHITVLLLDMLEQSEAELLHAIARGLAGVHAFILHVNGIIHFDDERTIYADPVEKDAVLALAAAAGTPVSAFAALHGYAAKVTDHPHLTIASGLKPAQFRTAWAVLAGKPFTARWNVTEVALLKRPLEPGARYVELRRFALGA